MRVDVNFFLQLLVGKIFHFISDNVFDNRVAAEVVGDLCWAVVRVSFFYFFLFVLFFIAFWIVVFV